MIKERLHYAFQYIHMHVNAEDQKCKLIKSFEFHYIPKLKFDFVSHEDAWPQNINMSWRDLLAHGWIKKL